MVEDDVFVNELNMIQRGEMWTLKSVLLSLLLIIGWLLGGISIDVVLFRIRGM